MRKEPRSAKPSSSIITPKLRVMVPVGSPIITYCTFLMASDESAQALWAKWVSVETEYTSTPSCLNSAYLSARSSSSVGQTNVKSAG